MKIGSIYFERQTQVIEKEKIRNDISYFLGIGEAENLDMARDNAFKEVEFDERLKVEDRNKYGWTIKCFVKLDKNTNNLVVPNIETNQYDKNFIMKKIIDDKDLDLFNKLKEMFTDNESKLINDKLKQNGTK